MSKCDLQIEFDRPNRTYRGGEEVTGTVHVRVNRDVRCDGLIVEHFWQTHGRGNTASGPKQKTVLFQGDLRAGESFSYPFRFQVPHGPPTYHGNYLNVDHYIHARVDIPWAIDPKHKEEYVLVPTGREYGNLPPSQDQQQKLKQQLSKLGLPIGIAMLVLGVVILPCGVVLIPLGLIVLFATLWKSLAAKRVGEVDLRLGSLRVAPGGNVLVELDFTPRKASALNGITAKLTAVEQCVSGSGTNKTTHTHKLHEQTIALAEQGQLVAGKPMLLKTAVPIPETDALSFSASDNQLIWNLEVRVDIPLWPDWVQKKVLTVRPAPAAEVVENKAVENKVVEKMPAPPSRRDDRQTWEEPAAAAVFPARSEPVAVEEEAPPADPFPPADSPPVEEPPEAARPAVEPPAVEPPAVEPPAVEAKPGAARVDSMLKEIVARLGSASRYGSQRDNIIREYAEGSLPCAIEIDSIERTFSYDSDERFRNGRTVTGVIGGTDFDVSLLLPEQRNDELDALGPGDTLQTECRLIKWNNIYDRLEMRED